MNYVILNNRKVFKNNITLNNLKEVDLHGTDRVDVVFAHLSTEILENIDQQPEGGDPILPEQWLLRDGGVSIILCKIDRDILYSENTKLIETMFRLFDQERFYIEIWGARQQESYNQLDQFIICYNKKFGYQEILQNDNIEKKNNLQGLLEAIQQHLL